MPARYNLDDEKIVELYESGDTFAKIANNFNISRDTVRSRLRNKNIILKCGAKRKAFDADLAYSLYQDGNTIQSIADRFNVSSTTVIKYFKFNGYERRRSGPKRLINLNDNAFSKTNNQNCYWAGFIAADGNVQGNQLGIVLKDIDYKHLEKFVQFVRLEGSKIFVRPNGKNKSCNVRFRSNQIINDLRNNFNIIPNKSLVLQPPNLFNSELIRHYIRGYFDGDGCFSINSHTNNLSFEICSGSCDILKWILKKIKDDLNVSRIPNVRRKKNNTYRFGFCGNKQVPKIMNWLYEDCDNNFLKRKKDRFENILTVEDY